MYVYTLESDWARGDRKAGRCGVEGAGGGGASWTLPGKRFIITENLMTAHTLFLLGLRINPSL